MPLLLIENRIINTDHLIRAEYDERARTLALYFIDDGNGLTSVGDVQNSTNRVTFNRGAAKGLWQYLSKLAERISTVP